jgi:hypothetical protein
MRAIGLRGSALAKLHDLNRQMMKPLDGILHLAALSCSCIGGSLPTDLGELFMSALMIVRLRRGTIFKLDLARRCTAYRCHPPHSIDRPHPYAESKQVMTARRRCGSVAAPCQLEISQV